MMTFGDLNRTRSMRNSINTTCVLLILCGCTPLYSQSISGSAYNIFGVGSLDQFGLLPFQSMGNAGIGSISEESVNLKNPASLSAVKGPNQIFDIGVSYTSLNQQSLSETFSTTHGGLNGLNYWFRASDKLSLSFGISKFSDATFDILDFNVGSSDLDTYSARFIGEGGLSNLYVAAGYQVTKNLSLGIRNSVLSGSQSLSEYLVLDLIGSQITIVQDRRFVKAVPDVGLQYKTMIAPDKFAILGVVYRPNSLVSYKDETIMINSSQDSLEKIGERDYHIPEKIGVGIGFKFPRWELNADFESERWSTNEREESYLYKDRTLISVGATYQKNRFSNNYFDRMAFRAGVSFQSNYVIVNQINYWNQLYTFGFGLPFSRGMINLGYQYATVGTNLNNLVKEKSHTFSLSFTFKDIWFRRGVYR